jgi:hypothetical protein
MVGEFHLPNDLVALQEDLMKRYGSPSSEDIRALAEEQWRLNGSPRDQDSAAMNRDWTIGELLATVARAAPVIQPITLNGKK